MKLTTKSSENSKSINWIDKNHDNDGEREKKDTCARDSQVVGWREIGNVDGGVHSMI